jgi:methylmalonyl-CoA carboxyltransferase small subunit
LKLKITVDGKLYEVDVEVASEPEPHPDYVPPARTSPSETTAGSTTASGPAKPRPQTGQEQDLEGTVEEHRVCRSPISGVVVRVTAEVGQAIDANDEIMILEAMKMETVITSPVAGTIARITVRPGDAVQAGQILVVCD